MSAALPEVSGSFGQKPTLTFPDASASGELEVLVLSRGDGPLADAGYRVASMDLRGHGDSDTTFATHGDIATGQDVLALVEHLGYGDRGVPQAGIKGGDTLVFVVDIVGTTGS